MTFRTFQRQPLRGLLIIPSAVLNAGLMLWLALGAQFPGWLLPLYLGNALWYIGAMCLLSWSDHQRLKHELFRGERW